jgi:hypothetical protein
MGNLVEQSKNVLLNEASKPAAKITVPNAVDAIAMLFSYVEDRYNKMLVRKVSQTLGISESDLESMLHYNVK